MNWLPQLIPDSLQSWNRCRRLPQLWLIITRHVWFLQIEIYVSQRVTMAINAPSYDHQVLRWMGVRGAKPMAEPAFESVVRLWCVSAAWWSSCGHGSQGVVDVLFPEWVSGGWVCSLDVAFTSATIRNCPQPFAWGPYGRAYGKFCKRGHFWVFPALHSYVSRGRRGTSWRSDVLSMQAQYFGVVFTRCVALFVAGATLWWPPSSLCVAGVAL